MAQFSAAGQTWLHLRVGGDSCYGSDDGSGPDIDRKRSCGTSAQHGLLPFGFPLYGNDADNRAANCVQAGSKHGARTRIRGTNQVKIR